MKEQLDRDIINTRGKDELWCWFGLSYASWLTLPRVLMHEMSDEWQKKMAELLKEYDDFWDFGKLMTGTRVQATKGGKLIKMPEELINYRHPNNATINKLKLTMEV